MLDITGKTIKRRVIEETTIQTWDWRKQQFYDVKYPQKITYEFEDGTTEVIAAQKIEDDKERWDYAILEIEPD